MIHEGYSLNRLLSVIWLSTSSFGGLLVFPAIKSYLWMVVIPVVFAYLAYRQLVYAKSRKILLLTSIAELVIGIVVGQIFYRDGELSGTGVAIIMLAFAASVVSLWCIWAVEKDKAS